MKRIVIEMAEEGYVLRIEMPGTPGAEAPPRIAADFDALVAQLGRAVKHDAEHGAPAGRVA